MSYAKAFNAALMTLLGSLAAILQASDQWPTASQWTLIATATWVAAWTTFGIPNKPIVETPPPGRHQVQE